MNRTLFLTWERFGNLLYAIDPIDENLRWIIRLNNQIEGMYKYELVRVAAGTQAVHIQFGDSLDFLQWEAVRVRLHSITDTLFNAPYLLDKFKQKSYEELLNSIDICENDTNTNLKGTGTSS